MAWRKTPDDRAAENAFYGDPEYQANRRIILDRARGRCELCHRARPLSVDHITPRSQGGTHALANLRALCTGPGSCHAAKSAGEGARGGQPADPDPQPREHW